MNKFAICSVVFLILAGCFNIKQPERLLGAADLSKVNANYLDNGYAKEKFLSTDIDIASGIKLKAVVQVTGRGNGRFKVANISPAIYDVCNDTETYVGRLLSVYLFDVDGDGNKDLVICGVKEIRDEKSTRVIAFRPEFMVWRFNLREKDFYPPFGIFDPYSVVRDYYLEIPNPENRIVLTGKFRYNLAETYDHVTISPDNSKRKFEITYALYKDAQNKMRCRIKLNGIIFK